MQPTSVSTPRVLGAVSWLLLITVMFGGESLIMLLTSDAGMSDHEEQFFRAGHGHAGVLTIAGILYSRYLGDTRLMPRAQVIAWATYALGVFMIAGGMFLHAYTAEPGSRSAGIWVTASGGVVLGGAVVFLAVHLLRNRWVPSSPDVRGGR